MVARSQFGASLAVASVRTSTAYQNGRVIQRNGTDLKRRETWIDVPFILNLNLKYSERISFDYCSFAAVQLLSGCTFWVEKVFRCNTVWQRSCSICRLLVEDLCVIVREHGSCSQDSVGRSVDFSFLLVSSIAKWALSAVHIANKTESEILASAQSRRLALYFVLSK